MFLWWLIRRNKSWWCGPGGWRCDVDPPELGTVRFASAGEDGGTSGIEDMQSLLVKVSSTAFVAELAQTEEVIGEPWYDMAVACSVVG